ncbi:MAG: response regulator receiver protein [Bryobacterales bacterium]|nr:response regulator receiver protein [Bryobacterales bacterium]
MPSSTLRSRGKPAPGEQQRYVLLVAEDNLPDALMVREAIASEKLPLEVFVVADGRSAIEFIVRAETDASAPCPDLLLVDVNLPKNDGFDVLRRLRASQNCGGVPAVVMTSSDSPADRASAAALGAAYFRKPLSYDEFLKLGALLKGVLDGISS